MNQLDDVVRLNEYGTAELPNLLTANECASLLALADSDGLFRSTVNMDQHSYGIGKYSYFDYPLPSTIHKLRADLYERLVGQANEWHRLAGLKSVFPADHAEFIDQCRRAGQRKPTCLILCYGEGGRNNLHQDSYGKLAFPFQVVVGLSDPTTYQGGEFTLLQEEGKGRVQFVTAHRLSQGSGLVFPSKWLPPQPSEPPSDRPMVKHGVAPVVGGVRLALGIVFQDAN